MSKLAYDYTNEDLVDAVGQAAAQAGFSNSGMVIDIMAGSHRQEYIYEVAEGPDGLGLYEYGGWKVLGWGKK